MTDTSFLTPPLSPKSLPTDMPPPTGDYLSTAPSPATTVSLTPALSASVHSDSYPLAQILVLYHKATTAFLLRQPASAYSTSLEALELLARTNQDHGLDHSDNESTLRSFFILKQKLWILHATIFGAMLPDRAAATAATAGATGSEHDHHGRGHRSSSSNRGIVNGVRKRISGSSKDSPEKLVKDLWRRLVEDYGGVEGDVDGQVMVPFTMLCINQKLNTLARQIVEAYLPTIPEGMLIHLQAAAGVSQKNSTTTQGQKDPLMTNYERLVELYLIHVLAKLSEWDFATEFLQYNNVLSDSSKKTYGKILDKLHQKSLRPKKAVSTKKLQHQSTAVDPPNFGSKSTSTVTSPTIASTSVSSPTLSSASTLSSPETSHTLEPQIGSSSNASKPGAESGPGVVSTKKSSSAASSGSLNNTRTTIAVSKKDSSAVTLRGRALLFLQHYVKLIRQASGQMGTNQLMIVVGLVVFMGALSRNRTRASKYLKAGMAKVMDTVKMGTTVTSI